MLKMKKSFLVLSMIILFLTGSVSLALAQEQPKPKKDTVNMDTDAKPTFFYAAEDEKSESKGSAGKIAVIAGAVVVISAAGFFLIKRKR